MTKLVTFHRSWSITISRRKRVDLFGTFFRHRIFDNGVNTEDVIYLFFSALGAAYGTAKSGTGIAAMSVMRPELIMKSIIAIYGLVIAVLIAGGINPASEGYKLYK
jgi:hypothetical protein